MINIDIHMLSFQNMTLRRRMLMKKDANIWKNGQHGSSVSFWVENQMSASLEHLKMNPASNNAYSNHFYINRLLIFFNCIYPNTIVDTHNLWICFIIKWYHVKNHTDIPYSVCSAQHLCCLLWTFSFLYINMDQVCTVHVCVYYLFCL